MERKPKAKLCSHEDGILLESDNRTLSPLHERAAATAPDPVPPALPAPRARAQPCRYRQSARDGAPTQPVLVNWTVPHAVAAVRAVHPHLRVQLFEGALPQLIKQLDRGVLHCVMGLLTPEMLEAGRASNLRCEQLFDERLEVIAARSHPLARRHRLQWADVVPSDWILPPERTLVRQALARTVAEAGLLLPPPVVESAQLATNIELAAAGVGIALAPHIAARRRER